jgi:hypothetical protein
MWDQLSVYSLLHSSATAHSLHQPLLLTSLYCTELRVYWLLTQRLTSWLTNSQTHWLPAMTNWTLTFHSSDLHCSGEYSGNLSLQGQLSSFSNNPRWVGGSLNISSNERCMQARPCDSLCSQLLWQYMVR